MSIKNKLGDLMRSNSLLDNVVNRFRLLSEMTFRYNRYCRHTGQIGTAKNENKYMADLRKRVHSLEKALALPNPRAGFGEKKVLEILKRIAYYKCHFQNREQMPELKAILDSYFAFNGSFSGGGKIAYNQYVTLFDDVESSFSGGTKSLTKSAVRNDSSVDFRRFAESRYSVRNFSDEPVDTELIRQALKIAEKSPSACNRQPWRVYVYKGKRKNKILTLQGGNKGFTENIDTAILVACNLESYFVHEMDLPFVDGGLYAMTLMFALHSLGLGTIPLSCAMMKEKQKVLYKRFEIKDNEIPVLLIGVGNLKERFEVAVSNRYGYDTYTTFVE